MTLSMHGFNVVQFTSLHACTHNTSLVNAVSFTVFQHMHNLMHICSLIFTLQDKMFTKLYVHGQIVTTPAKGDSSHLNIMLLLYS